MKTEAISGNLAENVTQLYEALAVLKLLDQQAGELDTSGQVGGAAAAARRIVGNVHQSLHGLMQDIDTGVQS